MSVEWHYRINQQEFGPVPFEELCSLAKEGSLTAKDQVKKTGEDLWLRVDSVPGLLAATRAAADNEDQSGRTRRKRGTRGKTPPAISSPTITSAACW
jgi:hypothetical protein